VGDDEESSSSVNRSTAPDVRTMIRPVDSGREGVDLAAAEVELGLDRQVRARQARSMSRWTSGKLSAVTLMLLPVSCTRSRRSKPHSLHFRTTVSRPLVFCSTSSAWRSLGCS
jgi:hypothetical protein